MGSCGCPNKSRCTIFVEWSRRSRCVGWDGDGSGGDCNDVEEEVVVAVAVVSFQSF